MAIKQVFYRGEGGKEAGGGGQTFYKLCTKRQEIKSYYLYLNEHFSTNVNHMNLFSKIFIIIYFKK